MDIRKLCHLLRYILLNVILQGMMVFAKRDPVLYCGACSAVITEIQYAIEMEDPRRTIDVGSFRIDPDGKRKHETIPYAGSETHLHDLVEDICEKMTDYAKKTDPETSQVSYVRFQARGDEPIELEHVTIDAETGKKLKIACGNFLEEYEDDLIEKFKTKTADIHTQLCSEIAGYCPQVTDKDEL
ncbi:Protein canopy-like 1 [Holothuria leucospilota]|uniref:Protein canopy-like 1 n=1 Tax=Holothuria leucospilota TaxID=206669 RepID=A0A9Q1H5L1_HOLLE|nr:Protein canopy-like 1 [Holothuria leucospilota]